MYFLDKLNDFKDKKINIYVDMDGCISEYLTKDKEGILNNAENEFFNKRPLYTIIDFLREINKLDNITLYILSACYYEEQVIDKNEWLDKYAPFFKKENRFILAKYVYNIMDTKQLKIEKLNKIINKDEINIVIEDDHSNMRVFKKVFPSMEVLHISSIIK